ncbi:MAG TPA: hypothetical protein VMY99_01185 [Nevskiaceae bacterium]|nr:hypothetical protein [Nevskiaceae bacterium]
MNKRHLHHLWTRVRPFRTGYFAALFVACAVLSVFALRGNNLTMVQLRNDVYQADKDNGDVEAALQKLRAYVYGHMNTNLSGGGNAAYPPVQLKYTYQRLQQAEQVRINAANSQIYTDAQAYCERLYPHSVSGGPRVPCIGNYVSSHGVTAKTIPDALYKFNFTSPSWSPDLAGWSLVASALLLGLTILRFAFGMLVRRIT